MKDIGKMIYRMVTELKVGPMAQNMRELIRKGKRLNILL